VIVFDFSGKIALITGAAGNLGRTTAQLFQESGAKLVLSDLKEGSLREHYAQWQDLPDILLLPADLNDEQSVRRLVDQAISCFGRIDVLANIAGGFKMGPPLRETPVEDWNFMLDTNAHSMFLASRAIIPAMLRQGAGRIISVSARAAREGKANMGPYCVSKAAVITLTETLAAEHKFDNINVNCILPGTIDTPQNREAMPEANFSNWVPTTDLANVILFLASDEARSVTGAAIPVYGRS
jgi:NAD(P)-dependent dehydrogenase (short-subunit alcohol dehydrogenase family)